MPIRADGPTDPLLPVRTASWWIRQIHFYSSLALAGLTLFFAATGFIANRSDFFDNREGPPRQSAGTLPADVILKAGPLSDWFSTRFPGTLQEKSFEAGETEIRFELESVWSWHEVSVDRSTRAFAVNTTPSSKIDATIGLHRGKWAGPAQRLLVDLTALALILVTCTGICIAVTHPNRSRRWIAIGLVTGSLLLVLMLCLNR